MQRLHRKNLYWMALIALIYGALTALIHWNIITPFYQNTLITIMFNMIYALGLNLVLGVAGQFTLGHAGFIALGAYSTAVMSRMVDNPYLALALGMLIGVLLAVVVALVVGIPTLRLKGDYLAIATLGVGEIIRVCINNWRSVTNGPAGIAGITNVTSWQLTYALLVLTTILILNYAYSSIGRATRAIAQDDTAAEAMGIRLTRYKVAAFVLAAATAAVGGALQATYIGVVTPNDFTFNRSIDILIIVVFGGIGSFTGTIIAAIVLGILNLVLQDYGQLRMVIYGVALIVIMIFRPGGLLGTHEWRLASWIERWFKPTDSNQATKEVA